MNPAPFVSYAQNAEDVVLWRALGHVSAGRYVQVIAGNPPLGSVTRAFDERGWSGVTVEAMPALTDVLERHGANDRDIHFMLINVESVHPDVLQTVDLRGWRPWVLVVASPAPSSADLTHEAWDADLLAAGYRFCLFDGMSRFYVAEEHARALQQPLSYPACAFDAFTDARSYALRQGREDLIAEVRRWRAEALRWWAEAGDNSSAIATAITTKRVQRELDAARSEMTAIHATLSWRITRPIRAVRSRLGKP